MIILYFIFGLLFSIVIDTAIEYKANRFVGVSYAYLLLMIGMYIKN